MKRFEAGYLLLGSIQRIPIRIHWTAPLMAVLFSRLRFAPAFWAAFLVLILIHELGHAVMVRLARAHVTKIDLDGAGGLCYWRGRVSPIWTALISWGGIFGQLAALIVTYALVWGLRPAPNEHLGDVILVFTRTNLVMGAYNLLPIRHLDGKKAWPIVPLLYKATRERLARASKKRGARSAAQRELDRLDQLAEGGPDEISADVENVLSRISSEVNKSSKKPVSEE